MVSVCPVLANLAKLQTRHNGVRTRQVTRLALVVTGVVLPSTLVAVAILLRIKRKDRKVAHLAIGRLDSEIWHSRLLRAVRTMVAKTASPLLLGRVKVESFFAYSAVNHVGTHVLSLPL
jgi:hypothetical protein